jgi:hypothetical protein
MASATVGEIRNEPDQKRVASVDITKDQQKALLGVPTSSSTEQQRTQVVV